MIESEQVTYYYPNRLGRIVLLSLEEIIGRVGVNAILNQANLNSLINNYPDNNPELEVPFDVISRIQVALEEMYGVRSGRGLALRAGRASFRHGLREYGAEMGFTELAFRLLPLEIKVRQGADTFAELFNRFSDQRVVVEEEPDRLIWKIERCPVCWKRKTTTPACHLAVGLIQEALYWVSNSKFFNVEETECIAKGDPACLIIIDKHPLD